MKIRTIFLFCLLPFISSGKGNLPKWVKTHHHPKYPEKLYIVGVGQIQGTGIQDIEKAKEAARVDIASQLKIEIKSTLKDIYTGIEKKEGKKSSSYLISKLENTSEQTVNATLEGVQIVETGVKKNVYYALAVLDKEKLANSLSKEIAGIWEDVNNLFREGKEYRDNGKIIQAVESFVRASNLFTDAFSKSALFRIVSVFPVKEYEHPSFEEVKSEIQKTVSILSIEKKAGDNQSAVAGEILKEPLEVLVLADGSPVDGIPVCFSYMDGEKIGESITDSQGLASIKVAPKKKRESKIVASVSIHCLPREFEEDLSLVKTVFSYELARSEFSFKVSIKEKDIEKALSQAIQELGHKVASVAPMQITGSCGIDIVDEIEGFAGKQYVAEASLKISISKIEPGEELESISHSIRATGKSKDSAKKNAFKKMNSWILSKEGKSKLEDAINSIVK